MHNKPEIFRPLSNPQRCDTKELSMGGVRGLEGGCWYWSCNSQLVAGAKLSRGGIRLRKALTPWKQREMVLENPRVN